MKVEREGGMKENMKGQRVRTRVAVWRYISTDLHIQGRTISKQFEKEHCRRRKPQGQRGTTA